VNARKVRLVPNNPLDTKGNWGLRADHLKKHFFGDSKYSLSKIDPGGNPDTWMGNISRLFSSPNAVPTGNGMIDIVGHFPRADGSGMYRMGVRLCPKPDGTFDLITVLTKQ
jgi:hypothetical protein